MPANEDQHFVPRLYLKNFADDEGKINILNLKNFEIYSGPYKSQCQEDYFYGKDLFMERLLGRIENNAKAQIESIVRTSIVNFETLLGFFVFYSNIEFTNKDCYR